MAGVSVFLQAEVREGCGAREQWLPRRDGDMLAGAGCEPECCELPLPTPGSGVRDPCGDLGGEGALSYGHIYPAATGTTYAEGAESPLVLDFTLDLTPLPENATVMCVLARYFSTQGAITEVRDDGGVGEHIGGGVYEVYWGPDGVRSMAAAGRDPAFRVVATCSFTPPPPANFGLGDPGFDVHYRPPVAS